MRELVARLVAIESVNPTLVPGGAGEAELARFVAGWLERAGLEVSVEELAPSRANVVARARGRGGGRALILNAHLDTVGLGGPDGGLRARADGDRLYGRGAKDMKGSLAAIMLAAAEAAELDLAGDVIVAAVADEEARSIGAEAVAAAVTADAAIVAEPTGLAVAIGHRGFVWLELETSGRAAHGSRYDLGIDAIARMGPPLVALGELDERLRAGAGHALLGPPSLHASLIEGGRELSTYPERCLLTIERRTIPGETAEGVAAEVRAAAPEAAVRTLFAREPLETARDAPIVETLLAQATGVLGATPPVVGVPFWTDAAVFSAVGIPAAVFGPGGEGEHAETEWVSIADVVETCDVLLATAAAFCSATA